MQITVCGTCRKIKPTNTITELTDDGFRVPVADGVDIATCEPCYVPTLRMVISVWEAAGKSRPDLVEHIAEYEEQRQEAEEDGDEEASPAGGELDPRATPAPVSFERVQRELSEVAPPGRRPGGQKPAEHKFSWSDWTEDGKTALIKWAREHGLMGQRGVPKAAVQTKFAEMFRNDSNFRDYLTPEAYKAYMATV